MNRFVEGDHDSGVDETTQSKESAQTPVPIQKTASRASLTAGKKTPSEPASPSKGSPTAVQPKLPMNKIQVGNVPSPNLKTVQSKVGSMANASYKPGGGNVKIESRKIQIEAKSRVGARNEGYVKAGGDKKIQTQKLSWNAQSKIGSLGNTTHKPGGGDKKIESRKLDFKDKAKSKVGSTVNIKHAPGGGNVKIFDDKNYMRQSSSDSGRQSKLSSAGIASSSKANSEGVQSGTQTPEPTSPPPSSDFSLASDPSTTTYQ